MLRSHGKIHHRGRRVLSEREQKEIKVAQSSGGFRTSKSEKYSQPPGGKPVDGIEVLQGFMCPESNPDGSTCSTAFRGESTFIRHLASHPTDPFHPKLDPGSFACYIQTVFVQGNLQSYFSVETSLSHPDPPPTSAYPDALKLLQDLPSPQIPPPKNDKERESIHWYTRWPELMEPFCHSPGQVVMLRSLTSFPQEGTHPDWLIRAKDHGREWWAKAESEHQNCTPRTSRLLKSPRMSVFDLLLVRSSADLSP